MVQPSGALQHLVEAAGQRFHSFRNGLDYAFIQIPLSPFRTGESRNLDAGRLIRLNTADPSARSSIKDQRTYESLQGSPGVCPLATPRRYHGICQMPSGFTDVSPVFTWGSLPRATIDRTRVRKRSASGLLHA